MRSGISVREGKDNVVLWERYEAFIKRGATGFLCMERANVTINQKYPWPSLTCLSFTTLVAHVSYENTFSRWGRSAVFSFSFIAPDSLPPNLRL